MYKKLLVQLIGTSFIFSVLVIGCKKNTPSPYIQPGFEFIEATSYDVKEGDLMGFKLRATGRKEDIKDSIWIKVYTNHCPSTAFTLGYKIPDFPDMEFNFRLYAFGPDRVPVWHFNMCPGVDTTWFKFWIRDKEGKVIDTVGPDRPILIRTP
jgi:hypothetical protein